MKTRDERRRAATRSGRFGAARLRFRLSSGSCLVAVRTGRVRCRVWFYGSSITDVKRFEVIIDGAQHGCGRVANSRNAACTVRRKLHRGARVVSCHVVVARMWRRAPCCRRWYDVIECRWCRASVTVIVPSSSFLCYSSLPWSLSYAVRRASCYTRDKV